MMTRQRGCCALKKLVLDDDKRGPHGLPVGDGSGGESVMPPQQRKIIAMRA
jgi:hypothetical protein